jgi:hypothetical protein
MGFVLQYQLTLADGGEDKLGWTRDTGYNIKTVGDRVGVLVDLNLLEQWKDALMTK